MRRVFVDTSAFVALRNRAEREHEPARAALRELISERVSLFTSNYVFAETYTALLVRVGRTESVEWGRRFRAGQAIELLRVDEEIDDNAWTLLESHADKDWSYVDASSFALMAREGVDEAFAFDRHFVQRGLRLVPAAAPGSPPPR
ncbi:MAG TPA: PIN domain-containing protein [Thermoleophilaceae bacterium]|nr:PIN domain-containing protein [Thermoleophilaceae bacterium]